MAAAKEPAPSFDLDRLAHAAKRLLAGAPVDEVAAETGLALKEVLGLRDQLLRAGVAQAGRDSGRLERTPTLLGWIRRAVGLCD